MCDAVRLAVKDVAPAARLLDPDQVSGELEKRISDYWGPDHGISQAELHATARDVIEASVKG